MICVGDQQIEVNPIADLHIEVAEPFMFRVGKKAIQLKISFVHVTPTVHTDINVC